MGRLFRTLACLALFIGAFAYPAIAAQQRPVVFIPGILGSKLCKNGEPLWGNRSSLINFGQLALDSENGQDSIVPCGLVEKINLFGPFWTIHQYDAILSAFRDLGYTRGQDLFIFDYDWRRSNFETAQAFKEFVDRTPQLRDQQFDIVAHSMGGIVTRIYLQKKGGISKVRKVVYLGTPFQGSMNALATLSDGWGAFLNRLAGGLEQIRRTILTMPAFYELFPRYASCCRIGNELDFAAVDILNFDNWQQYGWLPKDFASGPRADKVKYNLTRAQKLRDLLQPRQVTGVDQVIVAGDAFATSYYLYASKANPAWQNWRFSTSRGDGTVPVWSAVNSLTSLAGTAPSFSEHATIFDDQATKDLLKRELVSNLPPPVVSEDALFKLTTTKGTKDADLIEIKIEPQIIPPNGNTHLSVLVAFKQPVSRSEFIPTAELLGPNDKVALRLDETTSDDQKNSLRLAFSAEIAAPHEEGAWRVNVIFPGQGSHAAFFETLEAQ
jgi:pimeloyl-ACP methyl ester carboxylesterase